MVVASQSAEAWTGWKEKGRPSTGVFRDAGLWEHFLWDSAEHTSAGLSSFSTLPPVIWCRQSCALILHRGTLAVEDLFCSMLMGSSHLLGPGKWILKSVAASRLRVLGPHMAKFHQGFRTIEDSMVAPGALEMLLHYSRKTAASLHPLWLGHRMSALWVQASDTALPGTPSGATGVLENVLLYLFFMNLSLLLSEENNLSQRAF